MPQHRDDSQREMEKEKKTAHKMRTQMKNPAKKSEKLVAIIQCQSFWCLFFQNSEIDKITIPVNLRVCDITFFFSFSVFFLSLPFSLSLSVYFPPHLTILYLPSRFSVRSSVFRLDITFFCSHPANHSTMSAHQKFTLGLFSLSRHSFHFQWT